MVKQRQEKREDIIRSKVKNIFESYGYEEYKMRMFEKYSLYVEHRDFIVGDKVVTFTDLSGELLALRPDVTLSIVKNTKADLTTSEKVYYCENVYREDKQNGRFKEINQLGLELIGRVGRVELAETINLALDTLAEISDQFVLELSNVDFIFALLSACGFDDAQFISAKIALKSGSQEELRKIAQSNNVSENLTAKLCALVDCSGEFGSALKKAKELIVNDDMQSAYDDMASLYDFMSGGDNVDKIRLDFSLTGEENYYNGIIMSGFIRGVPKAVLSGGQYDKLLVKMDKNAQAIGFAVYLGELALYMSEEQSPCDVLIIYGDKETLALKKAREMRSKGLSVRTEKVNSKTYSAKETIYLGEDND